MSTDVTTATAPQAEAEPDLNGLAQEIVKEHKSAMGSAGELVGDVLYIGRLLLKAWIQVKAQGLGWEEWVVNNLPFGPRQATKYLKLARNPEAATGDMTLRAALRAMLPTDDARTPRSFSTDEVLGKIVRLINRTLEQWPEGERDGLTLLEKILKDALKATASIRNPK